MVSRRTKQLFYFVAAPLLWANAFLYRAFRAPAKGNIKLHLGPRAEKLY